MRRSSTSCSVRRARPGLGTIVEVGVVGRENPRCLEAIDSAFLEIERVERELSFYRAESCVERFNNASVGDIVAVPADLLVCFTEALYFCRHSGGSFTPFLEQETRVRIVGPPEAYAALTGHGIEKRARCWIDLGGIAKGFAVDRAVESLESSGMSRGIVNAGGDLRLFGATPQEVTIRHPENPAAPATSLHLARGAVCTSWFRDARGYTVPGDGGIRLPNGSTSVAGVTILAERAVYADALTKLFSAGKTVDPELLDRFNAQAIILEDEQWFQVPVKKSS